MSDSVFGSDVHGAPPTTGAVATGHDTALGSDVIEVAVALGNSVVEVNELRAPASKKAVPTKAIWIAAAAAFVIGASCFFSAVSTAADNQASKAAWAEQGRPYGDFRPEKVSPWVELGGLGGLAVGLALAVFGAARRRETRATEFGDLAAMEPRITTDGDLARVAVPSGMSVSVSTSDRTFDERELALSGTAHRDPISSALVVTLPAGFALRAAEGARSYLIRRTTPARRSLAAMFAIDSRSLAYLGGAAAAAALILGVAWSIPPERGYLISDGSIMGDRLSKVQISALEDDTIKREKSSDGGDAGSSAVKMEITGEGGSKGKGDTFKPAKGELTADNSTTREQAIHNARHAGILGAFQASGGVRGLATVDDYDGEFQSYGVGCDSHSDAGCIGAGNAWGESFGNVGGNGGPIKTGRYNTIGSGDGVGDGVNFKGSPGHRGGTRTPKRPPPPEIGTPVGSGGLDKALIRRAIARKKSRIRTCYERELLANPNIEGTINAAFSISPRGKVLSARASGFDSGVASCVRGVIASIQFPATKDGSIVNVTKYPFRFRQAGR